MIVVRGILIAAGLALGGYGALLLIADNPWPVLINIGIWAAAGVIFHDFVFAPACVAIGLVGRRLIPRVWWAPFAVAALLSVVVMVLAIPVYDRPGARPDNPTVLDHDYHRGVVVLLALIWAGAAVYIIADHVVAGRRRGQPASLVDRQAQLAGRAAGEADATGDRAAGEETV